VGLSFLETAMRQMKNTRTGKVAVFDESLVATGRWVEVVEDEQPKQGRAAAPAQDEVAVKDEVQVTLTKGKKHEGQQRKA
jgi:hypothetical protein